MWVKILAVVFLFSASVKADCFDEVSQKYQINKSLLKAIAYTESRFNANATNCSNSNGTCDFGFAQINLTEWDETLKQFGISVLDLQDACQNLHFGAWVLAMNFKTHGRNWNSVGAYNAGFAKSREAARQRYIALVQKNLEKFVLDE